MKFRLQDIPPEGKDTQYPVDLVSINERLDAACSVVDGGVEPPRFTFAEPPQATLHITLEGRTVDISGNVSGEFQSICARCTEFASGDFDVPVRMILKPHSERARPGEEVEDLQLSFYDGKEFDCGPIVEEAVVLALPTTLYCKPDCKGLCVHCGKNLNDGACGCRDSDEPTQAPFALLKQLKLH